MALSRFVAPWSGELLRHRPAGSGRPVVDDSYLGQVDDNRWSVRRVRAYYFALDRGVVEAEHARHVGADVPSGHTERLERDVFRVRVALERVLDLTDPQVVGEMGAGPINDWILDLAKTQAAGSYLISQVSDLQAFVVPSVAFLDDHSRFNVVVFRDAIDPAAAFGPPEFVMSITLDATGA